MNEGIVMSIGHSEATFEKVKEAEKMGVTNFTHLFNGMLPLHHREPCVAGSALMGESYC